MKLAAALLVLSSVSAFSENAPLNFDTAKLCQWQHDNNSMDIAECTKLEDEAKAALPDVEAKADAKRKDDCIAEGAKFAIDSGFASYTLYASCMKDGPNSL